MEQVHHSKTTPGIHKTPLQSSHIKKINDEMIDYTFLHRSCLRSVSGCCPVAHNPIRSIHLGRLYAWVCVCAGDGCDCD